MTRLAGWVARVRPEVAVVLLVATSCSAGAAQAVASPGPAWGAMSFEQKKSYMRQVVMPRMAEVFRRYSPRTYANFGCKTCHGPSAERGSFRMPNPALLMAASDVQTALNPDAGPIAEFMVHGVDPAMTQLLGRARGDSEYPGDCGCFRCHTLEQ